MRNFMFRQTQEKDLALLVSFTDLPRPKTRSDIPTHVLIPAFILSELRAAFTLGFLIYIPFLVIDLSLIHIFLEGGPRVLNPSDIPVPKPPTQISPSGDVYKRQEETLSFWWEKWLLWRMSRSEWW